MSECAVRSRLTDLFRSNSFQDERKLINNEEHRANIENLLYGLDTKAYEHCNNLIQKLEKSYAKKFVPLAEIYTPEELQELQKVKQYEKSIEKCDGYYQWNNFKLPINLFETSVFYHRHGLNRLKTKDKIQNKAIIDAGCYIADSILVLRDEFPNAPIYAFEPAKNNYKLAQETIKLNNIKNVTIENAGLGDNNSDCKIKTYDSMLKNCENTICDEGNEVIQMTTLDEYVEKNNISVGLIKVDIEGYEQKFLQGAKNTIITQKPILLISIYHNYNDFYKIKPLIESWHAGYKFDFFQGVHNCGNIVVETLLLAECV